MQLISLTEVYKDLLLQIPLFDNIPLSNRHDFVENLDFNVYEIEKNDVVARQNTFCRQLMILIKGRLRVDSIDSSGNEILIEYIEAPRTFASPYLFNSEKMLPATFKSEMDGVLLLAKKESLIELFGDMPHLLKNFLCVVGNCTKCSNVRLKILSYKNMRSRFVAYLFEQQAGDISSFDIEHNQVELADYLCVTRPALTKEISKMVKEGLLSIKGKRVELLNINELNRCIL